MKGGRNAGIADVFAPEVHSRKLPLRLYATERGMRVGYADKTDIRCSAASSQRQPTLTISQLAL